MKLLKLLLPFAVLLGGCAGQEIDAILAKYDTFGSSESTGESSGSSSTSTTGTDAGDETAAVGTNSSDTSSTGQDEATTTGSQTTGAQTTGAQTTGAQTTGAPVCGDGVVEGDLEECDDQNDNAADGCLADCTREWLVFITSEPFTQGDIKGTVGADYQCRHRAAKLFLPNAERYRAWISTSTVHAADRLYHARGPYKLVNGLQVAASWDALIAGPLDNPINVSELSETVNAPVFTGTAPSGFAAPNTTHCDDWTDAAATNFAWFGASTEVNSDWTMVHESICGVHAALYCFEQP